MKANAPDKIWIDPTTDLPKLSGHIDKDSVEYIRKDAFIEKTAEWLNNFYNKDTHSYLIDEDIEKFIKYMKGE
jgi:hypothetical protein